MTQTIERSVTDLPFAYAKQNGVFIRNGGDGPEVVRHVDGPIFAVQEAYRRLQRAVPVKVLPEADFMNALQRHYQGRSSGMAQVEDMDELDLLAIAESVPESDDLMDQEEDAPVIRLINAIMQEAIKEGASDIHIEPFESQLHVRFRVDGVLRDVLSPRRELAPMLISRIKVMSELDIAEKRMPQDGRISLRIAGREIDVRVSTIPTAVHERVVMRLLDKQNGRMTLSELGMPKSLHDRLSRLIASPHGIILVTGPTGSGKTTTLYGALDALNDRERNIMTVEDPIEYKLHGVSQTQVSTKSGMTFAMGLRAILRQDPDVVMVGEIRDRETVEIAVQASLTGHLVLSTLHTNTAAGAISRLQDMNAEPVLVSGSLRGVLAQRLVRTLCADCKTKQPATDSEMQQLGLDPALERRIDLYSEAGCKSCSNTGFKGRAGVYELIEVDQPIAEMINNRASQQEIEQYAHTQFGSISESGRALVLKGETTLREVMRVVHMGVSDSGGL